LVKDDSFTVESPASRDSKKSNESILRFRTRRDLMTKDSWAYYFNKFEIER